MEYNFAIRYKEKPKDCSDYCGSFLYFYELGYWYEDNWNREEFYYTLDLNPITIYEYNIKWFKIIYELAKTNSKVIALLNCHDDNIKIRMLCTEVLRGNTLYLIDKRPNGGTADTTDLRSVVL
jgi:hypothetical protein